jgi:hypothetical protein
MLPQKDRLGLDFFAHSDLLAEVIQDFFETHSASSQAYE